MNSLELDLGLLVLTRGSDGSLGLAHVGEGTVFGLLVDVVHWLRVLLLVVDEGAAVGTRPAALITFVWMFPSVTPSVVDQIVRPLELLTTEVTSMTELRLVDELMFLERMFQFERHPAILASKISDVGVDLQVDVVGGYLVESLAALLAAPAVASDTVGPQVDVDTVPGLELLTTLVTAVGTVMRMFEENMELHVPFPVELPGTVRTVVAHWLTLPAPARLGVAGQVLDQPLVSREVPPAVRANVDTVWVAQFHVVTQVLPQVSLETAVHYPTLEPQPGLIAVDHLLVDVELSVTDKVHITLGTPVVMLLRWHVSLPHVSLPVLH